MNTSELLILHAYSKGSHPCRRSKTRISSESTIHLRGVEYVKVNVQGLDDAHFTCTETKVIDRAY